MDEHKGPAISLVRFVHDQFLWLLIGSYAVAAILPGFGVWIRNVCFGKIALLREQTAITLPMVMLAFLLLNAGLGIKTGRLRALLRRPLALFAGLAVNFLAPIAFILGVTQVMRVWHNPDEVHNILVGLALVASMPVAGSSTAWSQNANGDLALSLGLVLFSTFLSPLTTPVALHSVALMTSGGYAGALHELAHSGTGVFLTVCVLVPSLTGIVGHGVIGEARLAKAKPLLKLSNGMILLLLNYSNAAVSLPETAADPDWDFLAVTLGIVIGLCAFLFASGWLIARLLKADYARQASLMFGLGMNNNGTGLVLGSMALGDHPRVLLPIIFYNLVQHLAAATSARVMSCRRQQEVAAGQMA